MSFLIVSCRRTGLDWCKSPGDYPGLLELPDTEGPGCLSLDVIKKGLGMPSGGHWREMSGWDQSSDQMTHHSILCWCPKILWLIRPSTSVEITSQIKGPGSDVSPFWCLIDLTSMDGPQLVCLGSPPSSAWSPLSPGPKSLHSEFFFFFFPLSISVPFKPSLLMCSICPTFFVSYLHIPDSLQDQEYLPLIDICSFKFTSPLRKVNPEKTGALHWGPVLKVTSLPAGFIQEMPHGKESGLCL